MATHPVQNAGNSLPPQAPEKSAVSDRRWLVFGYVLIAVLLLVRLAYLASGAIELSGDEAYQWLWSKHLALSYYSKPPGIAYTQFLGTWLWSDTQFGVRFFSPVCAAVLSWVMLRFMAREVGGRLSCLLLLIITSAPLMGVGSILMTIDPLLVLFWTLSMIFGWRAVQSGGTTGQWLLTGLAAGLAFLCKYSAAYLIICWALFFLLWPASRIHLKKAGPWLALLVFGLCMLPVIIWNAEHGWITVHHVESNAGLDARWHPTLKYFFEYFFVEMLLLNPVFYLGALWAMVIFWKRRRENPLLIYFFCMGGVVYWGHLAYSLHSRIMPNWLAPAVLPMFCLMVIYWDLRWREGCRAVKGWLIGGLVAGLIVVILAHDTRLLGVIAGQPLPGDVDPLRRVSGYQAAATVVEQAREKLAADGKPAFIICGHYGITGEFTFYSPKARAALRTKEPLVYCITSLRPQNQLYFWPEYYYPDHRKGENAIYVVEPGTAKLESGWLWKWLKGEKVQVATEPKPAGPPEMLLQQFDSVTNLGMQSIKVDGRIMKRIQLFECRNLH
jgi:4-amino-4-deoxy-L-arabinose transferase-like glycosyltransferase